MLPRVQPTDLMDAPGLELDLLLNGMADVIEAVETTANAALPATAAAVGGLIDEAADAGTPASADRLALEVGGVVQGLSWAALKAALVAAGHATSGQIDAAIAAALITDHGGLTGLGDDDHSQYHTDARGDARYAPLAKGVTNGDSHDHNGGDGAPIAYTNLSGKPTLGGAAALNVGTTAGTVAAGDDSRFDPDPPETVATLGSLIAGATAKPSIVGADSFGVSDSAAGNVLKKTTLAELLETIYKTVPRIVMSVGTPFVIMPGDGASGLQFTGTAGNYTLSAAIITNGWNYLKNGFWMYLTAGFGGSAYPAGWYWSIMTSDTTGVLYTDTYTTGDPVGPASPTVFPSNLTGWQTATTAEVVGPNGFTVPGGAMGGSGVIQAIWKLFGNIVSTRSFWQVVAGTKIIQVNTSTTPLAEVMTTTRNMGKENAQNNSRSPATAPFGIGAAAAATTSTVAYELTALDTTVDMSLAISMKLTANTACAVLLGYTATVFYGA
jgi:hypothetical protein